MMFLSHEQLGTDARAIPSTYSLLIFVKQANSDKCFLWRSNIVYLMLLKMFSSMKCPKLFASLVQISTAVFCSILLKRNNNPWNNHIVVSTDCYYDPTSECTEFKSNLQKKKHKGYLSMWWIVMMESALKSSDFWRVWRLWPCSRFN